MFNVIELQQIGDYDVVTQNHHVTAWYNPSSGHWIIDNKEVGFLGIIFDEKIISVEFIGE